MCNLSEGLLQKGADRKELELFLNLRQTTHWSDEVLLAALDIPVERRARLLEKANKC